MNWLIPGKTFLVGEYAAIFGGPAIVLTTNPCFELTLQKGNAQVHHSGAQPEAIHPDSPAGRWWANHCIPEHSLVWHDPYKGKGGLGASSAQFLGAYLASCQLQHTKPSHKALLEAYYRSSWDGQGLRPSGYDLLAQSQHRCVYVHRQQNTMQSYNWVFDDLAFLLLHSGKKLATHTHLAKITLADENTTAKLANIAESAQLAFEQKCPERLLAAVDDYQTQLTKQGLVAPHSLECLEALKLNKEVLAAKGCGALGADVLLLLINREFLAHLSQNLTTEGWTILASSDDLYMGPQLLANNAKKLLEISP